MSIIDASEPEGKISVQNPRPRDEAIADGEACRKAAMDYEARGMSVVPNCPPDHLDVYEKHGLQCDTPGKCPYGRWKERQQKRLTQAEINTAWRRNPYLNVGSALGPVSGLVRIDIDGEQGEEMIRELCGELPSTWEFASGGGGRGLLFKIPDGVNIRTTTKRGEGLHQEVRFQAKGAQTVLPPSRHESGRYYAWVPGRGPDEIEAAFLPPKLAALMAGRAHNVCTVDDDLRASNHTNGDARDIALRAMAALGSSRVDGYEDWLHVGMILLSIDGYNAMLGEWDRWSRQSTKYKNGECASKWKSFTTGGGLRLGTLVKWAQEASPGFEPRPRAPFNRAGGSGASNQNIVEVIASYLRLRYNPTFRRGPSIWAETLGREVQRAEACAAPTSEIIPALLAAADFPHCEAGPKRSAIPTIYRQWAPMAWSDLIASLPDEADSPEIAESASEQFQAAVADAMMTVESFSYKHRSGTGDRESIQRRSLIDWCRLFAKPGRWQSIRSLSLWCRLDKTDHLQVAIHHRLFGQIRRGNLAPSTHRRFVQLCELYSVGKAGRTSRARFVELSPEFIADLLDTPQCYGSCDDGGDTASLREHEGRASQSSSHTPSHAGVNDVTERP